MGILLTAKVGHYGKIAGLDTHKDIYIHECEWCKKEFDTFPVTDKWCYKIREQSQKTGYKPLLHWFCTWSCQMAYEKAKGLNKPHLIYEYSSKKKEK